MRLMGLKGFLPSKDRLTLIKIIRQKFEKYIIRHNWWRLEFVNNQIAAKALDFAMKPCFEKYGICVSAYGDDENALWFTH